MERTRANRGLALVTCTIVSSKQKAQVLLVLCTQELELSAQIIMT